MSNSELEKYAALQSIQEIGLFLFDTSFDASHNLLSGLRSIKHAQAREQAVGELEGLRIETQNNIAQLRVEAERYPS